MGRISIAAFSPSQAWKMICSMCWRIVHRCCAVWAWSLSASRSICARAKAWLYMSLNGLMMMQLLAPTQTPHILALRQRFNDCCEFIKLDSLSESHDNFATFAAIDWITITIHLLRTRPTFAALQAWVCVYGRNNIKSHGMTRQTIGYHIVNRVTDRGCRKSSAPLHTTPKPNLGARQMVFMHIWIHSGATQHSPLPKLPTIHIYNKPIAVISIHWNTIHCKAVTADRILRTCSTSITQSNAPSRASTTISKKESRLLFFLLNTIQSLIEHYADLKFPALLTQFNSNKAICDETGS